MLLSWFRESSSVRKDTRSAQPYSVILQLRLTTPLQACYTIEVLDTWNWACYCHMQDRLCRSGREEGGHVGANLRKLVSEVFLMV